MRKNFYCQQKCGDVDFDINEWNKAHDEIQKMPIDQAEKDKLIHGVECTSQCFSCIAIVGETRAKNAKL
jgi:hypothetical protein